MHVSPTPMFPGCLWTKIFPSKHTEKHTTLFHNENFVTALKSSELGESANKERCVQPLPDPDPTKTFTPCKKALQQRCSSDKRRSRGRAGHQTLAQDNVRLGYLQQGRGAGVSGGDATSAALASSQQATQGCTLVVARSLPVEPDRRADERYRTS